MKTLQKLLPAFLLAIITFSAAGQTFEVPKDWKMKKKSDYAKYEQDVLKAIDWLEHTPIVEQTNKRKEVNAFVLTWMMGTPKVTIQLKSYVNKFSDPNTDALVMFMAGWSKFALDNPDKAKDKTGGELAGIRMVIKVYKDNMGYQRNETIEEAYEADQNGKLEEWIRNQN